ncbi:MAG TPA: ribonuclease HII [Anaerolineales bacterium]|jgi:ribonuclease HII|nr:ribonuclease HII [Anaerolineales bacterium]
MRRRIDPSLIPDAPDFSFEIALWDLGMEYIAGIDEAGRGPLAGPVAAAAVIFPAKPELMAVLNGVRDSKELLPERRETWCQRIKEVALSWGVGFAAHTEIDECGIVYATRLAAWRALQACKIHPQHLLLDYIFLPDDPLPQTALIKGDARSLSIAAASILAKTARDAHLVELEERYPGYGFAENKGYGTTAHLEALARLGPSPVHRLSFGPVRERPQGFP